jgi:peptidoglycan/xylan/chitin deacetylase (PgdA/CDA1 family)
VAGKTMRSSLLARILTLLGSGMLLLTTPAAHATAACQAGTLYLTFDTGNMRHAELIADTLARHGVKATFFLAQEETTRGDHALDASWAPYWRARVAEGHAFGSHTWRHGSFRSDSGERVRYRLPDGRSETLDAPAVCEELKRPDSRFQELTGHRLDPPLARAGWAHHPEHAGSGAGLWLPACRLGTGRLPR